MKKWLGFFMTAVLLMTAFAILPIHGEAGIYDNVIRLHVLAHSDSAEDQALKLTVRDAVVAHTEVLLSDVTDRAVAEEILRESLPEIEALASRAVRESGYEAPVAVTLDWESYPTREYEALAFPAGEYLSLRVMIGEASGQNWWCVLFPPLCLSAASDAKKTETVCLSAGLTDEQYRMIADTDKTQYKLRFKILEVAKDLFS